MRASRDSRRSSGQNAPQVAFAENQSVIQTFASDRADEPLREGFCHGLCGAVRTALHSVVKLLAVDLVTVAQR